MIKKENNTNKFNEDLITMALTPKEIKLIKNARGKKFAIKAKPREKKKTFNNVESISRSPKILYADALIKSVPITFNIVLNKLMKDNNVLINREENKEIFIPYDGAIEELTKFNECLVRNHETDAEIRDKNTFKCDDAIEEVVSFHNDLILNHSVVEGTARFNLIRNYAIRMLEEKDIPPLTRVAVGKVDRWPSKFNLLRPLYYRVRDQKCSTSDRVIRSILYLNRLVAGNGKLNTSEILKTFTVSDEFISKFSMHLGSHKNIKFTGSLRTKPSTRVISNGPNGKPKWITADVEAYVLVNSKLHDHFRDLCIATENHSLYDYMVSIAEKQDRVTRKRLRYLTAVQDKGNKCRIVAISDYWTQVLLEPIMKDIQEFTKTKFKGISYSHDHSSGFINLQKFIKPGIKSYDITSWTDAFPASLQKEFMRSRYGTPVADAWHKLVVECEWEVKDSSDKIQYGRGQGMGTNGSFDIATATDLFLLEMMYKDYYKIEKLNSRLLNKVGDDLWCYDPDDKIRTAYETECGISINLSKTKTSTENNLCGEFVSRNINNGVDVSRISANICRAVEKNILDIPQLAHHLQERDYESIIPLREIFHKLKIKGKHRKYVIRTFYFLCKIYKRDGLELLEKSIKDQFSEELNNDDIIGISRSFFSEQNIDPIRDAYYIYSINALNKSIDKKATDIFRSCMFSGYTNIQELEARSVEGTIWCVDDPVGLLTSKYILATSYEALNNIDSVEPYTSLNQILDKLTRSEQNMSFKQLGLVQTSGETWRPKATKLYNICKSLYSTPDCHDYDYKCDYTLIHDTPMLNFPHLATSMCLPYSDPLFHELRLPITCIGKVKKFQPSNWER